MCAWVRVCLCMGGGEVCAHTRTFLLNLLKDLMEIGIQAAIFGALQLQLLHSFFVLHLHL